MSLKIGNYGRGLCLRDGTPFMDAALPLLHDKSIFAIGINCSSPGDALQCFKELSSKGGSHKKRLAAWPNATPWSGDRFPALHEEPDLNLLRLAPQFKHVGVTMLGGCCGVDPAIIKELSTLFKGTDSRDLLELE